jgi:hypothetical protein
LVELCAVHNGNIYIIRPYSLAGTETFFSTSGEAFLEVSDTNYAGQSDDIQDSGFLLPLFLAIYMGVNLLAE